MKRIFTFLVILLMTSPFFAQSQNIQPKQQVASAKHAGESFKEVSLFSSYTGKSEVAIPEEFKDYAILSLRPAAMKNFVSSSPETISFSLPGKKSSMLLELVKVTIVANDFSIIEMPSGKEIKPSTNISHYRGIVKNSPNSIAAITILDDEVSGIISLEGENGNLVLGKLDNSKNHILYEDKDISHLNDFVCQTKDSYNEQIEEHDFSKNVPAENRTKCPEIFFDYCKG